MAPLLSAHRGLGRIVSGLHSRRCPASGAPSGPSVAAARRLRARCPQAAAAPPVAAPTRVLKFSIRRSNSSGSAVIMKPQQAPAPAPPVDYAQALRASLRRDSITAAQLLELATSPDAGEGGPLLQQPVQRQHGSGQPLPDAMQRSAVASCSNAIDAVLDWWRLDARVQAPRFERQCSLKVPGVADAAAVTRGGRMRGQCKDANQDAFVACSVAHPDGSSPAMLIGVFDGHGSGGEAASQTAAGGLAGAVPAARAQLKAHACTSSSGSNSSSSRSPPPPSQQALVTAFQAVAASMAHDSDFIGCGAAGVACLVEEDSITAAWAGDCRAVVGLHVGSAAGPSLLVHSLTQDHKPNSPLERSRISASPNGRVVQPRPGQPHRLCGVGGSSTLSLSRAFGDGWAAPLGLTAEPDAVTVTLPPRAPTSAAAAAAAAAPSPSSPCDSRTSSSRSSSSSSFSSSSSNSGEAAAVSYARHVLVLGCDGLWDMVGNTDAVTIALSAPSAEAAAEALLHAAQRKWAVAYAGSFSDDITVAVAFLPA